MARGHIARYEIHKIIKLWYHIAGNAQNILKLTLSIRRKFLTMLNVRLKLLSACSAYVKNYSASAHSKLKIKKLNILFL